MPAVTLYYDGQCPLCIREAALLQRLDRGLGHIALVDITAPDFDPAPLGRTQADVMARIHGTDAQGRLLEGLAVFRAAYGAVGRGWLLAPTAWPVLRPLCDAAYRWFARHRVAISTRVARLMGWPTPCADLCHRKPSAPR